MLEASLKGFSIYQKAVPLRPGLYKIDIVIKDVNSGNVGVLNTRLRGFADPGRQTGSQLADSCRPDGAGFLQGHGRGPIRARLDQGSPQAGRRIPRPISRMGVYLQFYNLKVDDKTHKNNVSLDLKVTQGDKPSPTK